MARKKINIGLKKTETEYRLALERVSYFFDHPPAAGSALETEFKLLMMVVERYEDENFVVESAVPVATHEG